MKTILVPFDFSECAKHALDYARFVAWYTNAEIVVLHVLPGMQPAAQDWTDIDEVSEKKSPEIMKLLQSAREGIDKSTITPDWSRIKLKRLVEYGSINKTINQVSKDYNVDFIIMGTHGSAGDNFFKSSNVAQIVRDARVPVITINELSKKEKIDKILFATDFSKEANFVLPQLITFAKFFGAQIHFLKVITGGEFETRDHSNKMIEVFKKRHNLKDCPVSIHHNSSSKDEGIRSFADLSNADMIAIGTHGRQGMARFLKGSVAEGVVNHSTLPVLTFNMHNQLIEKEKVFIEGDSKKVSDGGNKKQHTKLEAPYLTGHTPII